ncbi:12622_t:CDS:2 [Entrophospora sp. SA101]|nr:12622_t:CDS:2 [Entrophospora sp. SA101]
MGNNNPILPPAIDWRNWSDWAEYLIRIQAIRTASSPGGPINMSNILIEDIELLDRNLGVGNNFK